MSKRPTDAVIKREADRLLTLPGNPGDSIELARALKRHAKTEYHVRSIVQHLLDNQQFYPTPSAIRETAEICLVEPPPKYKAPESDCSTCGGTGFRHVVVRGIEYSGVCECRKAVAQ